VPRYLHGADILRGLGAAAPVAARSGAPSLADILESDPEQGRKLAFEKSKFHVTLVLPWPDSAAPDSRLASPLDPRTLRHVMETAATAWTEEELMALPKDGCKRELIGGEIIMSPAGYRHERIVAVLLSAMLTHAVKHRLGVVCGSGLGCWMASGNLLSPDVSFIAKSRLAVTASEREKYLRGAPDLVVEVLSPWDRSGRLQDKLADYFSSGARLVWVIDPGEKSAVVYRTPEADRLVRVTDALDGEDVLPGFRLPLAELFSELSLE